MKVFPDIITGNTARALERTFFAVEATSFEQQMLWDRHANTSLFRNDRFEPVNWEQMTPGWTEDIGKLGRSKLILSLFWAEIDNRLVLFWHPCSAVSDSRRSERWLKHSFKKKWDQGTRWSVTDASNFHLCLNAIREANRTAKD